MDFAGGASIAQSSRQSCAVAAALVAFFLAACAPRQAEAPADLSPAQHHATVAWHAGTIEEAFSEARSQGKPVFLYWGAEWCPPCHYLKNKIFTRAEFASKMTAFIAVYLDGDTERAQILGEELEVEGYPTVIIFDPSGSEVMRISSTIPIDRFAEVLDAALLATLPIETVLSQTLESGAASAPNENLRLLAFYSWDQHGADDLEPGELRDAFAALHRDTPAELLIERSRFLTLYLISLMDSADEAASPTDPVFDADARLALHQEALTLLREPALRDANLMWVLYRARDAIDLLQPEEVPERHQLVEQWRSTLALMEDDPALSVDDRLTATRTLVELSSLDPGAAKTDSALQEHVRQRVAWALKTVSDDSELQAVMSTMAYLLQETGLANEAQSLLTERMHTAVAPYYFMSWIGRLKEEAGETAEALVWYQRAWQESRGRYSRFRWGSSYLRQLMKLTPENEAVIKADSLEILSELLTHGDAFAGGNLARLSGLETAYRDWQTAGGDSATIGEIRDLVQAACDSYPDDRQDSQHDRCRDFLRESSVQIGASP